MLSTTAERIYWKQETRNRVAFSEWRICDLVLPILGGTNLGTVSGIIYGKAGHGPKLP